MLQGGISTLALTQTCLERSMFISTQCLGAAVMPCNSWLFLLRVRGLPKHTYSRITLILCTVLWSATFTSFLVLLATRGTDIPSPPGQCFSITVYEVRFMYPPFIVLFIFDTAVSISILLGLSMYHSNIPLPTRVQSTVLMENAGPLHRAFLQSGYVYYMSVKTFLSFSFISLWRLTVILL